MSQLTDIREPEVKVTLGGRERIIKFDLNAFAELESRFGSVETAMKELQKGGMKSIRTILWAGLIHDEVILDDMGEPIGYKITPYQVGGWVSPASMPLISEQIGKAMQFGMPDVESNPELKARVAEVLGEISMEVEEEQGKNE